MSGVRAATRSTGGKTGRKRPVNYPREGDAGIPGNASLNTPQQVPPYAGVLKRRYSPYRASCAEAHTGPSVTSDESLAEAVAMNPREVEWMA